MNVPTIAVDTPDAPAGVLVHDTATGELIPVGPDKGIARLYVCGITPYDATHLGHANTYLAFDLLHRAWLDAGLEVAYTQNVTDVDEPLLERAERDGVDWRALAQQQTDLFRTDMEALRVLPPQHYVGATETIDLVVEAITALRDRGAVYQLEGDEYADWYFDVTSSGHFMEVSGLDEKAALSKFVDMGGDPDRAGKRHPLDPLVWQQARPGEPSWSSSLGQGRPGWHIECTAIALEHLGPDFDVQGGGSDLAFPHHEMCAAQARAISDEPFAEVYAHSGMVALDGEKMSKSKGNLELVSRLRDQGVDPMVVRLAMLTHHWRDDWEWTADHLDIARERLNRWRAVTRLEATPEVAPLVARVRTALRTDLDAPAALSFLDDFVTDSLEQPGSDRQGPRMFADLVDAVLGIAL